MPRRPLIEELERLLRQPIVIAALVVGIITLIYWELNAPPRPSAAGYIAARATPFPTITPGPSPTFGPKPTPLPPSPTPTPDLGAPGRDAQRKLDLQKVAAGLNRYFAAEGAFPETGPNLQSLCTYQDLDAGCQIAEYVEGGLPVDRRVPYKYGSDGFTWILIAEFEAITPEDLCKDPRAQQLTNAEDIFCIVGGIPTESP